MINIVSAVRTRVHVSYYDANHMCKGTTSKCHLVSHCIFFRFFYCYSTFFSISHLPCSLFCELLLIFLLQSKNLFLTLYFATQFFFRWHNSTFDLLPLANTNHEHSYLLHSISDDSETMSKFHKVCGIFLGKLNKTDDNSINFESKNPYQIH